MLFIMFVASVSLLTKKFPPDLKAAQEHINNLMSARENYTALVSRSKNIIEQQEQLNQNYELEPSEHKGYTRIESTAGIENVKDEIRQIKIRLNRIEEQNRVILEKIRK